MAEVTHTYIENLYREGKITYLESEILHQLLYNPDLFG